MEPRFKKNVDEATSFTLKNTIGQSFDGIWHFHKEYELVYISEGQGEKTVGDNISDLRRNTLLFLGGNLPHSFSCNQNYIHKDRAGSLVIHLNDQFLNQEFCSCPEMELIGTLLERASSGIEFDEEISAIIGQRIRALFKMDAFEGFVEVLSILNRLAKAETFTTLASPGYTPSVSKKDYQRINKVYNYVFENFRQDISLKTMTQLTNMTKPAFCRYFKKVTGKTFFTYLNKYRVGHACKLLIETNLNATEVSYKSGFNSISNFNKQFKSITGTSPIQYRNNFVHAK